MDHVPVIRRKGGHPLGEGALTVKQEKERGLYKAALVGNYPDIIDPVIDRAPMLFGAQLKLDSPTSWVIARDPHKLGGGGLQQYGSQYSDTLTDKRARGLF